MIGGKRAATSAKNFWRRRMRRFFTILGILAALFGVLYALAYGFAWWFMTGLPL